jgi:hypothetical protein
MKLPTIGACLSALVLAARWGSAQTPPSLPSPQQAQQLVEQAGQDPALAAQIRARIQQSGLTPEQIRARLRASGYPEALLDAYLGAPPRDWSAIMLAQVRADEARQKAAADRAVSERPKDTHPSVPLDRYVGHYVNEMYGDVNVANEGGHLVLRFGTAFAGDLEHWAFDSYVVNWHDKRTGRGFVAFSVDAQGRVSSVWMATTMPAAPPRLQDMDEFKRAVDETVQR